MNIQVNTDHNIQGGQDLNAYVTQTLKDSFQRFNRAITRIEVHISDENGGKTGGNDKKCLLEARISNHSPVVVSHHADTVHEAIDGATLKLTRALNDMVGKLSDTTSLKDFDLSETEVETEEEFRE